MFLGMQTSADIYFIWVKAARDAVLVDSTATAVATATTLVAPGGQLQLAATP